MPVLSERAHYVIAEATKKDAVALRSD